MPATLIGCTLGVVDCTTTLLAGAGGLAVELAAAGALAADGVLAAAGALVAAGALAGAALALVLELPPPPHP
jgi:hypothetical protein